MKRMLLALVSMGLFILIAFAGETESLNVSALVDNGNDNVSAETPGHGGGYL